MSNFGLTSNSNMSDVVSVLDKVYVEMNAQTQKILALEGQLKDAKERKHERKDLKESRAFQSLATWCGGEKTFVDWEFKLQQFVRSYKGFEEYLERVKRQDEELTLIKLTEKAKAESRADPEVDILWYDEQLYSILSLKSEGTALSTVKNKREDKGTRGANSWHKLTREVAGKTGVRLERLADAVHKPKTIVSYKDCEKRLIDWENDRQELEKLEGQGISDLTLRTILKGMIPPDLVRDLERDSGLKKWDAAWKFVLEQAPLRRDLGLKMGKDGLDAANLEGEKYEDPWAAGADGNWECPPCLDQEALTMKGGQKGGGGSFQGYCNHCGAWGHLPLGMPEADC